MPPSCPVVRFGNRRTLRLRAHLVDDSGELIGIVTRADLVRAFVRSDDEIAQARASSSS
jgi:CBS domain-containing protein